jgi:hypothetical protein
MSRVKRTHNGHLVGRLKITVSNSVSKRTKYSPIKKYTKLSTKILGYIMMLFQLQMLYGIKWDESE